MKQKAKLSIPCVGDVYLHCPCGCIIRLNPKADEVVCRWCGAVFRRGDKIEIK